MKDSLMFTLPCIVAIAITDDNDDGQKNHGCKENVTLLSQTWAEDAQVRRGRRVGQGANL
jgi:hypothetical protein